MSLVLGPPASIFLSSIFLSRIFHFAIPLLLLLSVSAAEPPKPPDITTLLQKGLFEEEVNRNYEAAITEYRQAVAQFDKQRQYAATAIFRLAECYRKLGRTGEAQILYRRILQEFSDQTNLVKLAAEKSGRPPGAEDSDLVDRRKRIEALFVETSAQVSSLETLLGNLKKLKQEELQHVLPTAAPDPQLAKLLEEKAAIERKRQALNVDYSSDHPEMQKVLATSKTLERQITERMDGILLGLRTQLETYKARRTELERLLEQTLNEVASRRGKVDSEVTASQTGHIQSPVTDEEQKEIQRIQALIKNSPDLMNTRTAGLTPLHQAANKGQLLVATYLLENGAEVDARSTGGPGPTHSVPAGCTPLMVAARVGHKGMVELMLKHGAKVAAASQQSQDTALHSAAASGFKAVVQVLLDAKADVNARDAAKNTPLVKAAGIGHQAVVELLVTHGAEVNAASDTGWTPLHAAVDSGHVAVVETLLAAKADVQKKDKEGRTPLLLAAVKGNTVLAKRLIEAGATVNEPDNQGQTPLILAANRNAIELVDLLLQNRADPNVRLPGDVNPTALIQATRGGSLEIAELLIKRGAQLNAQDNFGHTALCRAVSDRKTNLVDLLLRHQADPNLPSISSWSTPLHQAAGRGDRDTAQWLLDYKADINARSQEGRTPLHVATEGGFKEVMALLLARGADPSLPDNYGTIPLDLISRSRSGQRPIPVPVAPGYPVPPGQPQPPVFKPVYGTTEELGDLLRKHGASVTAPRPGMITVCRAATGESRAVLLQNTNGCNQFTLLELVLESFYHGGPELRFPLWEKTRIMRRDTNGKTVEIAVNLEELFKDCAKNVSLEWGDVVDIPEKEHLASDNWQGLPQQIPSSFNQCLARTVTVVAKGQTNEVNWLPFKPAPGQFNPFVNVNYSSAWLSDFLAQRRTLYLASSDLTRVTVKRTDPATQKRIEYVNDATRTRNQRTDLWLRHGDVIEIPEKP